jgi:hypothetical protein
MSVGADLSCYSYPPTSFANWACLHNVVGGVMEADIVIVAGLGFGLTGIAISIGAGLWAIAHAIRDSSDTIAYRLGQINAAMERKK